MQPGALQRGVVAADDSVIIRSNVRVALGNLWHVFLAIDGAEAIEYARQFDAELVVLDVRMPNVDGLDACAIIRNLPRYRSVPIVLLTAYDNDDLRRRASYAGATEIFPKPFSAAALRQRALTLVGSARAPSQDEPSDPSADPPWNGLSAGRDVLEVHRQVEAAAKQGRQASFREIMAAWRAGTRR
jgi:CheY-like chemotaxis protein